eukprot:848127_1
MSEWVYALRTWKRVKYEAAQFELQSVLDAAEQVTDCDDEDVYIEIGDGESDEDEEKDDNHDMLFGVQANANKKYKRYSIKVIILGIELSSKAKPSHIPNIIKDILQTYVPSKEFA